MSELTDILLDLQVDLKTSAINYVRANPESYIELEKLAFSAKQPEGWRAAWVLYAIVEKDKELIKQIQKKAGKIIDMLTEFNSSGQRREFMKVLLLINIPEKYMGYLINLCFDWLISKKTDIAVKVHAMQMIYNYSLKEPDLQQELKVVLEEIRPYGTGAITSRIRRIYKLMDKHKLNH